MFEKLLKMEENYIGIEKKLMDPEVVQDNKLYAKLMKEYKELSPIIEKFRKLKTARENRKQAEEMIIDSEGDPDLKEMAQEELSATKEEEANLMEKLKVLLLPKDPNDEKNVIIEIRGGAGGEEAALFSNTLFRMYSMYAEMKGWKLEVLNENPTELGGFKEITFSITGENVYSRMKYESGVRRVQRVPETESQGRIHTSTSTVAVLIEADEVEVEIDPGDLKIDVYRSSGAGGQHINKTESAVRITHLPTGIVVECQDERSQHKNKDRAMKILRSRIYDLKLAEQNEKISANRRGQVGTGDRSERIRTYNYPQGRVTDHRINLTLYKLEEILNGNLDELIDALGAADTAARLADSQGLSI